MGYKVEKLAAENALVGEGPMWDVDSQTLYWIDIQGGRFWNFDPATGENKLLHNSYNIAGVGRNKSGDVVAGKVSSSGIPTTISCGCTRGKSKATRLNSTT